MDVEVEIFFTSQSVRLLVEGVAEKLDSGPTASEKVYGFMRHASGHGAKFFGCTQAMAEYGVAGARLIPEYSGAGGSATFMARCLDPDWFTLVY
jgi:predicted peroxiredoxin